jgi:RHS repeat-associated protein
MRSLFLFILYSSSLFAHVAVTENDPDVLIDGVVNAITGDLYVLEEDIVVQGTEPLHLQRSYISDRGQGMWRSFNSVTHDGNIFIDSNLISLMLPISRTMIVKEANGSSLSYGFSFKENRRGNGCFFRPIDLTSDGKGLTNTARGQLSGQTNLKNQYLSMPHGKEFVVIAPNGTRRIYRALHGQHESDLGYGFEGYLEYYYGLHEEQLTNGNKICYDWDKYNRLISIKSTNPTGQKIYASASFFYEGGFKKDSHKNIYLTSANFRVETSDGRTLHYKYFREGEHKHTSRWYLCQILSSESPTEDIRYNEGRRVLHKISLPESRYLQVDYNGDSCVKTLSAPVGPDASPIVTRSFDYDFNTRKTRVTDSQGAMTVYYWNEDLRPTRIDRFFDQGITLANSSLFVWGDNNTPDAANLICKIFCDGERKPLHITRYSYDARGNVIQESFYGNISGHAPPLNLDSKNFPVGGECYSKRYQFSQDGKDLLLRLEEDNGLVVTYDYLMGTNLPTKEITHSPEGLQHRKLYEYNDDRILVREITDDGSDGNTRLIKQITPKNDNPFIGMPQIIEELYFDGQNECLLMKTELRYTTGGRISQKDIYDADGTFCYSLKYTYDHAGRLIEETDALGRVARSQYDALNNKTQHQDFSGNLTAFMTYDFSNRLISNREQDQTGLTHTTRHGYDTKHNKTYTVDFHNYETKYFYDSLSHPITTLLPPLNGISPTISSLYDAMGNEYSRSDGRGFTTTTSYNAHKKPVTINYPDGTSERFTYNLDGTLLSHTDQQGIVTTYVRDIFGRITEKAIRSHEDIITTESYTYDAFHLLSKTDAEGYTTTYTYDGAGRKSSERIETEKEEYSYDPLGRLSATKKGDLVTSLTHDVLDRVIEVKKESVSGVLLSQTFYTYDNAGNIHTIKKDVDGQESQDIFNYDAFGRLIEKIEPLGFSTLTTYDDTEHRKTTTNPMGLCTEESFNTHYLLSTLAKIAPSKSILFMEENLYDLNHNLISKTTTLPDRSVTTIWEYDTLDRLISLTESAGTQEQRATHYSYTPKGLPFQIEKPSGIVITKTYDPLDHLVSLHSSDHTISYTYQHDRLGRLVKSQNQLTRETLKRAYDHKGRLTHEELPNRQTLKHAYDDQGRRIRFDLSDNSYITYDFDALYLRRVTRHSKSDQPLYSHHYLTYDLAGNSLEQTLIGNLGPLSYSYNKAGLHDSIFSPYYTHEALQHDAVGNILEASLDEETSIYYTYDDLYQLTSEKKHTYKYDNLYNRLQKDDVAYFPNTLNQLPSEFTYSPDGNPISQGETKYFYDALDRLIAVENSYHRLEFTYDSYHRRLSKRYFISESFEWVPVQTSHFIYDDQNDIGSIDAWGRMVDLRILGLTPQAEIGAAVAIELYGKVYAPIHDLHGNVGTIVSISNKKKETFLYNAFGEEEKASSYNPWRFSSKRLDNETNLIYYGRRYYIPALGRWLTPDPLGFKAGPNLYAFVSNAPLTHVDLYGLFIYPYRQFNMNDFKQMGIGAIHGAGSFAWESASFVGHAAYGLSMRSYNWSNGRSSFSQDWEAIKNSHRAFSSRGDQWMQSVLPGDTNNELYRAMHIITKGGLEFGTAATGAAGIGKGVFNATKWALTSNKITKLGSLLQTTKNETYATSSLSSLRLKNRLISQEISGGHAFEKHVLNQGEFPGWIRTRTQFGKHIEDVINNPTKIKELRGGRTGYWHQETGTVVIRNPSAFDGGTAFQPTDSLNYFDKNLR